MQFPFFRKPRRPEHTKVRRIHMQFINMWMAKAQKWLLLTYKEDLKNSATFSCPRKTYACYVESKTGHQSTLSMDKWFPIRMWNTDLISALTNSYLRTPFLMWYMWMSRQWRCVLPDDCFSTGMDPIWTNFQRKHPNQSTHSSVCIFSGIMDSEIYQKILEDNLLLFAAANLPVGFRLYQVNIKK